MVHIGTILVRLLWHQTWIYWIVNICQRWLMSVRIFCFLCNLYRFFSFTHLLRALLTISVDPTTFNNTNESDFIGPWCLRAFLDSFLNTLESACCLFLATLANFSNNNKIASFGDFCRASPRTFSFKLAYSKSSILERISSAW